MRNEQLKHIKKLINSGCTVQINNGYLWLSDNGKYIMYQHYGQSAVRNSLVDLKWVIGTIFEVKKNDTLLFQIVSNVYKA